MVDFNFKSPSVFSTILAAALTLAASFSGAAQAAGYKVKILDSINHSPAEAYAAGINNRNDVAGNSCGHPEGCGGYRPALWPRGGAPRELKLFGIDNYISAINDRVEMIGSADTPTGLQGIYWTRNDGEILQPTGRGYRARPSAINNLGVIVGSFEGPDGQTGPLVWINKTPYTFKFLGPNPDFAALNDRLQIVGTVFNEIPYAVRWDGLKPKYLPSGANAFPRDINNKGHIVGYSVISGNSFPTLWAYGKVTYLPTLENSSAAVDINNEGFIVGSSGSKAVLWNRQHQITDLNDYLSAEQKNAGIILVGASGINDNGVIAGNALVPSSFVGMVQRPFLMTPK
jgi:uncharacterized membrane protein